MHDRIEEIQLFFSHRDYSLAKRRLLDLSLDTGDTSLLKEAISWSKQYNAWQPQDNTEAVLSPSLLSEADTLLSRIKSYEDKFTYARQPLLAAKDISKKYAKGNFSLQPVSVAISTGDVNGIVGENGNGKTTLLRCLAGQLAVDNGSIAYPQLQNPDNYAVKHHVAFIPQRIPRWYGQLKNNLHFSAALSGVTGEENHMMVAFMLERLNLSQYAHLTWDRISSGYRTRFEIARVLLQMPRLLILDEPLANLDINAQQTLLTDLRYLAKSARHPMGIFLSSQQLHEVEKIADVVYFIKMGSCLYHTGKEGAEEEESVVEIETAAERDAILRVFAEGDIRLQFNGGNYTISSSRLSPQELLFALLKNGISIVYFRDISHSTKRFF